jgi:hypothetical protein
VIQTVTDWAEVIGLLAIALGAGLLVAQAHGTGWGVIVFGTVILCMSAVVAALGRRKGGTQ